MELIQINNSQVVDDKDIVQNKSPFIEANTQKVTLEHLRDDCIVPVFAKDGEVTISHYQFIKKTMDVLQQIYPEDNIREPEVRVSHLIKGRIPSAIGKPVKELLEHEKTLYYERCAFVVDIPSVSTVINGNRLYLSAGGVRSLSQENLYSKKSLEKFKVFIGFQNRVCTNLCVSTDGLMNDIRIGSIMDLEQKVNELSSKWQQEKQLDTLERFSRYSLDEKQFAHVIGKVRMFQHINKKEQESIFSVLLNDSQINQVVKDYYQCPNHSRSNDGSINMWNFYNLLTNANKSSYIDSFLERGLFAYEFTKELCFSIENNTPNWYLYN